MLTPPALRPRNPNFSSGPCAKRPGWSLAALDGAMLGRSHRATPARAKLARVIEMSKRVLGIPAGWRVGIVPASDTGAIEMALWSLLGPRAVDVLAFDTFSDAWAVDIAQQLKLAPKIHRAPYGEIPDLGMLDPNADLVLAWNGTTSGAKLPDDALAGPRDGLVLCDATSAAFAMPLPWARLDVVTWSWQKALGGEAAHGMLALSPRAADRLATYTPPWPMPKIFRLTAKGAPIEGIFAGDTINTPSMLCVEDALDGLRWAGSVGLDGLFARSAANLTTVAEWVARSNWAAFLAADPRTRSPTAICLRGTQPWLTAEFARDVTALLDHEGVGYDLAHYRDAPPGFRIWGGATVEASDIAALLPWLDWAVATIGTRRNGC